MLTGGDKWSSPAAVRRWYNLTGEGAEEPALARQGKTAAAREYLRRPGQAARPDEELQSVRRPGVTLRAQVVHPIHYSRQDHRHTQRDEDGTFQNQAFFAAVGSARTRQQIGPFSLFLT